MKQAALSLVLATSLVLVGCDKIQEKLAQKAAEKAVQGAGGGSVAVNNGTSGGVTVTDPSTGSLESSANGGPAQAPRAASVVVPIHP